LIGSEGDLETASERLGNSHRTEPSSDDLFAERGQATDKNVRGQGKTPLQGSNQKLQRIVLLALEIIMRRGEILNIKRGHIDFQKSVLLIPSTKTDEPGSTPLSSATIASLRGQLRTPQIESGGVIPI